ncbi:LysR family transcriptional regulator [Planctomyces bekefii]|uniref:LysR family transcriptional regulator n=1 Tax=Planctomyces bekefii TaxID=1653850 RepID=A0A5C6MAC4_9PLAN|nr:LysR family transcriptional regulator [Planctomyces bekefii]
MNLLRLDLNLLAALDVLLEEKNVSRAATRLGVTQPAASSSLKRLRALFQDELLVRAPQGMTRTPRAEQLRPRIRSALLALSASLDPDGPFDPMQAKDIIRIGVNDYASQVVLPLFYGRLRKEAPGIKLVLEPRKNVSSSKEDLESGQVDLIIGIGRQSEWPKSLIAKRLFDDPFVTMVRTNHPKVKDSLSLGQFLELEHLVVSPQGHDRGIIDDILEKDNKSRIVALAVPHFSIAARLVAETDLICTIPERIARMYSGLFQFKILTPPLQLHVSNVSLAWHPRSDESPCHRWLRQLIAEQSIPSP